MLMRFFSRSTPVNLTKGSADTLYPHEVGESTDEALHATMKKPLEDWLNRAHADASVIGTPAQDDTSNLPAYQPPSIQPAPNGTPSHSKSQKNNSGLDYHTNLGRVITVLLRNDQYKGLNLAQIEESIIPAIIAGQFIIAETQDENTARKTPSAVISWALVSEDVDRRLHGNIQDSFRLNSDEWRSGNIPWLILLAGDQRVIPNMVKELMTNILGGRAISRRRVNKEGQAVVDKIDASNFSPRSSDADISRNDPCPCGSGKRYKHCHGALT